MMIVSSLDEASCADTTDTAALSASSSLVEDSSSDVSSAASSVLVEASSAVLSSSAASSVLVEASSAVPSVVSAFSSLVESELLSVASLAEDVSSVEAAVSDVLFVSVELELDLEDESDVEASVELDTLDVALAVDELFLDDLLELEELELEELVADDLVLEESEVEELFADDLPELEELDFEEPFWDDLELEELALDELLPEELLLDDFDDDCPSLASSELSLSALADLLLFDLLSSEAELPDELADDEDSWVAVLSSDTAANSFEPCAKAFTVMPPRQNAISRATIIAVILNAVLFDLVSMEYLFLWAEGFLVSWIQAIVCT